MAETANSGVVSGLRGRRNLWLLVISLAAFAILISLGNWQVRRLQWKQDLIQTIERRVSQAPVGLDAVLERWRDAGDVEYYPLQLSGMFRHDDEQHFLATHNGQSGWYVYTPLQLADGRLAIVNRGFVPYDLKDASARPWTPVEGTVTVTGLARNPLSEKPGLLLPDNAPADRIWYWKDFDAMAGAMGLDGDGLMPFFVDISTTDRQAGAGPVPGVTRISLPNRHLEYAVTWFGLAAALVVTAAMVLWRGRQRSNS